jgi:hypothetical protein
MNKLQQMQYDFRVAVAAYVQEFCNKHDWVYNPADWVAGDVGGVIEINDMFINFDDIRVDIDNEFDKDAFVEWFEYEQRVTELGCTQHINYKSFALGAPRPYSGEVLDKIGRFQKEVERMQRGE